MIHAEASSGSTASSSCPSRAGSTAGRSLQRWVRTLRQRMKQPASLPLGAIALCTRPAEDGKTRASPYHRTSTANTQTLLGWLRISHLKCVLQGTCMCISINHSFLMSYLWNICFLHLLWGAEQMAKAQTNIFIKLTYAAGDVSP